MITADVKKELKELKELLHEAYIEGLPAENGDVIGLDMAFDNLIEGEGYQCWIGTVKSALQQKSWFKGVLRAKLDDDSFHRAIELCESISKKLLLVTGDANLASVPLVGEWQKVEREDPLRIELEHYTQLRIGLERYPDFVCRRLTRANEDVPRQMPEQCQGPMNTLKGMISSLPGSHQLLTGRYMPDEPFTWIMHTSYLKFREKGNKFSRGKLLAAVREVMFFLHECTPIFTHALEDRDDALRHENEELYSALLKNDKAWRELAEKEVAKLAVGVWRKREEGGGLKPIKRKGHVRALLERLADLRG
jgi:hypothetical protein